MEYYYYVNIFETKGLEYILLLSFLALFVYLVRYLAGPEEKSSVPEEKSSDPKIKVQSLPPEP